MNRISRRVLPISNALNGLCCHIPRGALHIFWVRGLAIEKGIDFPDIGIKNGTNFQNFGIRNGTDSQGFGIKYKVRYTFRKVGIRSAILFPKNWYKERICF